ncbi:MAG: 5-oxoprolinase/urea amidolyase family protein [Gordonia sp. (in: high G+C Gram-positive bacteria)]
MRELRAGGDAIVLDFHGVAFSESETTSVAHELRSAVLRGRLAPCDVVSSAQAILIEARPGSGLDELGVRRVVRRARRAFAASHREPETATDVGADAVIPTVYDGADLAEAAELVGVSPNHLAQAHARIIWRAQFLGFAPGFAYLVPHPASPLRDVYLLAQIARRPQSRPSVPAGSVAVAAGYGAIYPREGPGGWYLLGHTDAPLWEPSRREPAMLAAGMLVRFVAVDSAATHGPSAMQNHVDSGDPKMTDADHRAISVTPASLSVLSPGLLATIQDFGRPGLADMGVARSGAADLPALALANRLVGNPEDAAGIEITLGGWSARTQRAVVLAVTGPAVDVFVDDVPVGSHATIEVPAEAVVRVGTPSRGARNYVAIRGGILAPQELGSASTDLLSHLGPRPLRAGDEIRLRSDELDWPTTQLAPVGSSPRVVELVAEVGPRDARLIDVDVLSEGHWQVTPASNRVGVRLDRVGDAPLPEHRDLPGMLSEGVPLGGIQIPPSGQPVIFLADHPVTGGYPVVAVLTTESLWLAAQLVAGDEVRLILR